MTVFMQSLIYTHIPPFAYIIINFAFSTATRGGLPVRSQMHPRKVISVAVDIFSPTLFPCIGFLHVYSPALPPTAQDAFKRNNMITFCI